MEKMVNDPTFRNILRNVPTVAFIAVPKGTSELDWGALVENMLIAAQSMNIGICCLGSLVLFLHKPEAGSYLTQLDSSADYEFILAAGFVYPDETPEAKPRDTSKIRYIG